MDKQSIRKTLQDGLVITSGSTLFALGLDIFLEPNNIAPGGVSGLSMILNHFFPFLPIGVMIMVLNIPLFIAGWKTEGKPFLIKSLFGTFMTSVMIDLFSNLYHYTSDPLLAALYGGILIGSGLGLIFTRGATTGGSDIISRLLKIRFPYLSMGRVMMSVDVFVITLAAITFGHFNYALYALISLFISSFVLDKFLYGFDYDKVAYIITRSPEKVFERIDEELDRGATFLEAEGAYSGEHMRVILCAIKMRQIVQLKQIVRDVDPKSFVIITEAHEVLGDGFRNHQDKTF